MSSPILFSPSLYKKFHHIYHPDNHTPCVSLPKYLIFSDPKLKELGESKYDQLVLWFKERLDDAIKAAEEEKTEGSGFFTDGKEEDGMCCLLIILMMQHW